MRIREKDMERFEHWRDSSEYKWQSFRKLMDIAERYENREEEIQQLEKRIEMLEKEINTVRVDEE